MKKINLLTTSILLPATAVPFAVSSCNKFDGVTLSGYTDPQVVGVDNKDYWVCAEPAATVRQKVISDLNRVASIQDLYGGDGFNQAVLVCKKSLLTRNPKYLKQICTYLISNESFISDANNLTYIKEFAELPAAVTTQSLINCNVKYVNQTNDKTEYQTFLNRAKEIDSSVELPNSSDFYSGFPSSDDTRSEDTYTLMYPSGAPAIAVANIAKDSSSLINTTTFTSVQSNIPIFTEIIKEEPDLAILPSNLGAKLFNHSYETQNDPYVWLSTVTWGNLYLLSKDNTPITKDNLKDKLHKKEVGVLQIASTPGLAFKIILKENNIDYED